MKGLDSQVEGQTNSRPYLLDLSVEDLKTLIEGLGERPYRANQVLAWVYRRFVSSFSEMTDLPMAFRTRLEETLVINRLDLVATQEEEGGWSKKFLWGEDRKPLVESVLLRYKYGLTGCVSTQVGCPVGCVFCASRVLGFQRNLSRGEIIEEFLGMCRDQGERLGHLVFMGTGEPFLNYDEVLAAIDMLCRKDTYGISRRKITVSTVGIPEAIENFAKDGGGAKLALSLHASKDETRDKLIPLNRVYPIGRVMEALRHYAEVTGQRVTVEYMLLKGINDGREDALRLSGLLAGLDCLVNLIPWNEVPGLEFEPPGKSRLAEFKAILERNRIKVTVRRKLGGNIEAACGQLRRRTVLSDSPNR